MTLDPLNVSRVGNRGNHSGFQDEEAQGITRIILEVMDENSQFFAENPSFPLPQFESDQVTLDKELGKGEFGKVSAIQALHVQEHCSCPKCCKPSPECCTQEINGEVVPLCCGVPVKKKTDCVTSNDARVESGRTAATTETSNFSLANISKTMMEDDDKSITQDKEAKGAPAPAPAGIKSVLSNNTLSTSGENPQIKVVLDSGFSVTDGKNKKHRRKDTGVSFAPENMVALVFSAEEERDDDSTLSSEEDVDEIAIALMPENLSSDGEIDFWRGYMSSHVVRQGRPRYAMKRLRDDLPQDRLLNAMTDLAAEAKFMSSMRHPNICKMRGTVSQPGKLDYAIVMDYLVQTLGQKMDEWKELDEKGSKFSVLERLLHQQKTKKDAHLTIQKERYADKLLALYDAARAIKYLHNHS